MDLPVGISTLQRTDRWIGAPLCAILTLLRKIFESAGPPGPRQVQRILFVKFAEQGSTVLAYPAIRRATGMVGRENVYFVVFEDNRFILDVMEIIPDGNVITMATNRATHLDPPRLIYKQGRGAGCMRFKPAIKRTNSLGCFRRKPADHARTRRLTGLKTLARTRLLRPSERGQCDLLFLEEPPCFRRRQGLQFLGPPIAPMTVLPAGLLVPFAGMATQFI